MNSVASQARAAVVELPALTANKPMRQAVWLEDLDYTNHTDRMVARRSAKGTPLTIAGKVFPHGMGGTGRGQLLIQLGGRGLRFVAAMGIDDVEKSNGSKEFQVWLDDRMVSTTGVLRKGQIQTLDVDLRGADRMELLVAHGGIESDWDRFVLGGAQIVLQANAAADKSKWPLPYQLKPEPPLPLASHKHAGLSINGPRIVGGTPGRPFAHRLAISGVGPLGIKVQGLPATIKFDATSRTLRGTLPATGRFPIKVQARDSKGAVVSGTITLVGSFTTAAKALTPVMGWNSWNLWGKSVDAKKIRDAGLAMLASGLADHGFNYVNIDDGWEGSRDERGRLLPSAAFGDMAALSSELHV